MKYNSGNIIKNNLKLVLLTVLLLLFNGIIIASHDIGKSTGRLKVKIQLNYFKNPDDTRKVIVTVKRKEDKKIIYVDGVIINLYLNEISRKGMMGSLITGEDGKAVFLLVNKFEAAKDTLKTYTFIVRLNNDENYEDKDVSITIKEAKLELSFIEEDSIKYIKAFVNEIDTNGSAIPVEDIEVHFYVQRMFSLLPIGGDYTYTDENGEVKIEFPNDLPGDTTGNLNIIVKVEDDENFGNMEVRETRDWGVPVAINERLNERKLWASRANAPLSLIVISVSIILSIGGVLLYLFFQLYRIKKLSKIYSKQIQ